MSLSLSAALLRGLPNARARPPLACSKPSNIHLVAEKGSGAVCNRTELGPFLRDVETAQRKSRGVRKAALHPHEEAARAGLHLPAATALPASPRCCVRCSLPLPPGVSLLGAFMCPSLLVASRFSLYFINRVILITLDLVRVPSHYPPEQVLLTVLVSLLALCADTGLSYLAFSRPQFLIPWTGHIYPTVLPFSSFQ